MTIPAKSTAAGPLTALLKLGVVGEASDARLLEIYRDRRPGAEEAFRILVERHGPMVRAVCRSLVTEPHDADDAFQAVFLVLVRKAGAIRRADSLGPWLHGVALRVARAARRRSLARSSRLRVLDPADFAIVDREPSADQTGPIHDEIGRLPDRYRRPLVLCGLEGLSYDQAARALGISEPSLRGRLHRARKRLEERLKAQGVSVPWIFIPSPPPAALLEAVVMRSAGLADAAAPGTVLNLAKGAILAMAFSSWKLIAFSSLATLGVVGSFVMAQQDPGAAAPRLPPKETPVPASAPEPSRTDPARSERPPRLPTEEELEAGNNAIRAALAVPPSFEFPNGVSLEDLLKRIRLSTAKGDSPGIPIYVDPTGLSVAEKDMSVMAPFKPQGRPLGEALKEYLAAFNLGYSVQDGFMMVDSRAAAADRRIDVLEKKFDALTKLIEQRLPPVGDFDKTRLPVK